MEGWQKLNIQQCRGGGGGVGETGHMEYTMCNVYDGLRACFRFSTGHWSTRMRCSAACLQVVVRLRALISFFLHKKTRMIGICHHGVGIRPLRMRHCGSLRHACKDMSPRSNFVMSPLMLGCATAWYCKSNILECNALCGTF